MYCFTRSGRRRTSCRVSPSRSTTTTRGAGEAHGQWIGGGAENGHYVKLNHGWGESIYAHMQDISVAPGQSVRRGDLLGHSDNTGYSGGPHLHFSIRINPYERTDGWGGFSDPLPYMNPADYQLPHYVLPGPTRLSAAAAPAPATAAHGAGVGMAPDHPAVSRP